MEGNYTKLAKKHVYLSLHKSCLLQCMLHFRNTIKPNNIFWVLHEKKQEHQTRATTGGFCTKEQDLKDSICLFH